MSRKSYDGQNTRRKSTREGEKRGVGPRDRMKRGSGIKGKEERTESRGMETLFVEVLTKIRRTEPLSLAKPTVRRIETDPIPPVVH